MKNKMELLEQAMNEFMKVKYEQQDKVYTTINQFNDGLINYNECQQIVFDCLQKITASVILEFNTGRFF